MSDPNPDKPIEEVRADMQRLLGEIEQFRRQAEEQAKAAELSRQKADSEALYASNAKGACEGHSTTIANLKGTAEADANSIAANKQRSDELVSGVTTGKSAVEADAKATGELRRGVDEATAQLLESARKSGERLQETEKSRDAAEGVLREAKEFRDAAAEARTKAETSQATAVQSSKDANKLVAEITTEHAAATKSAQEVATAAGSAKTDREKLSKVLEHITKSDAIAGAHEARVTELSTKLESLLVKVESLLPGATSASLATAFNKQKSRFKDSQRRWIWTFVVCILCLVGISAPSFFRATFGDMAAFNWEAILRGLTARLPIAVPLIWLAIYAGRNYMLSLRIEEDYAYKEAISIAFEGYKREMALITAGDASNPSPLTTLCTNVLKAVAERPGRIYDGKHQDITLLSEAQLAVKEAEQLSQRTIART